jgi:8-oxo-dGTP pyrophosphatase MutT (NUDIX family)
MESQPKKSDAGQSPPPRRQVAALPYRIVAGGLEILLITSRDTGRWVIPKGGLMKKHTEAQAAAVEALEEAGLRGTVSKKPIGGYSYDKGPGASEPRVCQVKVYALAVTRQLKKFKEKGQRELQWMTQEEAAAQVAEPELSELIRSFAPKTT